MDGSEIGSFGTLRLMKRTTNEQVAAFPIDEETVTFGREPTCSVRLYYPDISPLHAKIVFRDRKAFLIVLGEVGLTIDGCPVLPSANPSLPTTIPVSNNCEIEIHKKRFIFSYPPKQLRSPLYNIDSPSPQNSAGGRRKLRMSMIHSAQVFTPRGQPSSDPLMNLRVLQSPIKQLVASPHKPSALRNSHFPEQDEVEEEIVLVESNTPHVVQEEKDLVILERVDVSTPPPTPPPRRPRPNVNMYQTPNRRTRPSLHRAVLIRSVQRAVMAREEEQEEKEVEHEIVREEKAEEYEEHKIEEDHNEDNHEPAENDCEGSEDGCSPDSDTDETTPQPTTWRKSLDVMRARVGWPFRSGSTAPEEYDKGNEQNEDEDEEDEDTQVDNDQDDQLPPSSSSPPAQTIPPQVQPHITPARASRPLGSFMTPQVSHSQSSICMGRGAGRSSFGGALRVPLAPGVSALEPTGAVETWGGAKRVRVEPKWRIDEIEVGVKEETVGSSSGTGRKRVSISEEERRAIQERRKSALTTPDPFFTQVPGLRRVSVAPSTGEGNTPKKLPSLLDSAIRTVDERITSPMKLGERSMSPTKFEGRSASPTKEPSLSRPASPTKSFYAPAKVFESPARAYVPLGRSVSPMKAPLTPHSEEDEEDTRSLLDRMKRTVDEIKRRRSGLFEHDEREEEGAETAGIEGRMDVDEDAEDNEEDQQADEEEENSDKENGRASLRPPSSPELEPDATETSHHTPAPLSPTCVALDLDLELERTPLPQLTRPARASRRQHTDTFSGPQTPALTSVKHLFPPPAPVPSTPAVKSMRALFRGAGNSSGMGISGEALDGVEEMMVTPEGYRVRDDDMPNEIEGEEQEREDTSEMEKEKEEPKPARTTFRKAPVPVPASAPATIAARRRTTRTAVAVGSNGREASASRPVTRAGTVPAKRTQTVLPKRAEKETERKATALEPDPVPVPGVSTEEQDEVVPQLAVQKKPAKARLLRAHKGVAAETSDEDPPAPKTRDASIEPRMRAASTQPRARPGSTEPRTRVATTTRKVQANDVDTVPKTRATRSRATPVPAVRSEPARMRARPATKPNTAARAPSRTKMHSTEDDDDGDDPLDSIGLPEAPTRMRRTRAMTAPVKEEEVNAQIPVPGKVKGATTTRRRGTTVVDKENTPSSSKEDESERKKEVEVKRTTRATRSRA